jgi:hypothetical protein
MRTISRHRKIHPAPPRHETDLALHTELAELNATTISADPPASAVQPHPPMEWWSSDMMVEEDSELLVA